MNNEGYDPGKWNVKGIMDNAKKGAYGSHLMKKRKFNEHQPTGKALALAKKLRK